MKIAIISDTHDNLSNLRKTIDWLNSQKIKLILHCGDICNQEIIDEAEKLFSGEIKWVRGNADYDLENLPEKLEFEIDGKKVHINHYPDIAKKAAESGKYDLAFYGHTHKPWAENIESSDSSRFCLLANPGELAGQRFKPTFAIYSTKINNLELKILEKL